MEMVRKIILSILLASGLCVPSAQANSWGKCALGAAILVGGYNAVRFFQEYNISRSLENFWLRNASFKYFSDFFSSYQKNNRYPTLRQDQGGQEVLELTVEQIQKLQLSAEILQKCIGQVVNPSQGIFFTEVLACRILTQLQIDIESILRFKRHSNNRLLAKLKQYVKSLEEVLLANSAGINLAEKRNSDALERSKMEQLKKENEFLKGVLQRAYICKTIADQQILESWFNSRGQSSRTSS